MVFIVEEGDLIKIRYNFHNALREFFGRDTYKIALREFFGRDTYKISTDAPYID